ncbi:V-type ATP synthase subunit I [Chloroflexota bacterium]
MIVKMKKVQVVVRRSDRKRLLDTFQNLGVLHITPIKPSDAIADSKIAVSLENVRRSVQVLSMIEPAGDKSAIPASKAADEVMTIVKSQAEYDNRLTALYRQLEQQSIWGDVTLSDLEEIKSSGIDPRFYIMSVAEASQIKANFSTIISQPTKDKALVAIVDRDGTAEIPQNAESIPVPAKDNPSIRSEAARIDASIKNNSSRLAELAHQINEIRLLQAELEARAEFSVAANGALTEEDLFAIQGWVPAERAKSLDADLDSAGIVAGIRSFEPEEDENPPTLIKYSKLVSPIKGLFDILNTFPGYHEIDLAAFFMIAMPIFAAMLIGDAGYGLIFILLGVFLQKKMSHKIGPEAIRLILIVGVATLIWGLLTANFFGVSPETMAHAIGGDMINTSDEVVWDNFYHAGGAWAKIGNAMIDIAPLWREDGSDGRELLIQISFIVGALHLIAAHVRRAIRLAPSQKAIADIGWSVVLTGMLAVIWTMFFVEDGEDPPVPSAVMLGAVFGGLALVALFEAPNRNPVKRVLVGFASALLPLIGTFGDTMSYIRLMAVGLASYYIAFAFNDLGATIAESGTWGAAAPILLFGHTLNIVLCVIAIFAHGVRLNMLEFSNNAGVQWAGYPYSPFSKNKAQANIQRRD